MTHLPDTEQVLKWPNSYGWLLNNNVSLNVDSLSPGSRPLKLPTPPNWQFCVTSGKKVWQIWEQQEISKFSLFQESMRTKRVSDDRKNKSSCWMQKMRKIYKLKGSLSIFQPGPFSPCICVQVTNWDNKFWHWSRIKKGKTGCNKITMDNCAPSIYVH